MRAAARTPAVAAWLAAPAAGVSVDVAARRPEAAPFLGGGPPRARPEELVAGLRGVIILWLANARPGSAPVATGRTTIELRPPAFVGLVVRPTAVAVDEVKRAGEALAVLVLIVRQPQRRFHIRAERRADAEALLRGALAALGRDHDRAVRCARALQCRGVRTLQHRVRRNVFGVDVRRPVADVIAAERAATVAAVRGRGVVDGNAVDNDQRLVLTQNRARAADHDARRAERVRRVRDLDAGDFAAERRDPVLRRHAGDPVAGNGLRGIRERVRVALDSEGRDHDLWQLDGAFRQREALRTRTP